jgi:hypothetical protein
MLRPEQKEIAQSAREIILDPNQWTTDAFARLSTGERCTWNNPHAICWCASGALMFAAVKVGSRSSQAAKVQSKLSLLPAA